MDPDGKDYDNEDEDESFYKKRKISASFLVLNDICKKNKTSDNLFLIEESALYTYYSQPSDDH